MFSGFVISLFIGVGAGFWIYNKFQRTSGGNSKNSAIASVIFAVFVIIVGTIIIDYVFHRFK